MIPGMRKFKYLERLKVETSRVVIQKDQRRYDRNIQVVIWNIY